MRPWLVTAMLAAACSDPTITVTFDFDGRDDLRAAITNYEVAVYEFNDVGEEICDQIALGEKTDDDLTIAFRTSTRGRISSTGSTKPAPLDDVPRLGDKALVFTGRDNNGRVIAGGCKHQGDIESSVDVLIEVEPTLVMRLIDTDLAPGSLVLPTAEGDPPVALIARERLTNAAPSDPGFRSRLRDDGHELDVGTLAPDPGQQDESVYLVGGLDALPLVAGEPLVGPLDLAISARWSDQILHIPALVEPAIHQRISLGDEPNQQAPSWVFLDVDGPAPTDTQDMYAAALYRAPGGTTRIKLFAERDDNLVEIRDLPGGDARALTVHMANGMPTIVYATSAGWSAIELRAGTDRIVNGTAPSVGAADQLLGLQPCRVQVGMFRNDGILGIVGTTAIAIGGIDDDATTDGDDLAAQLQSLLGGGRTVTLLGATCAVLNPAMLTDQTPLVAVRVVEGTRDQIYFLIPRHDPIQTPFTGAVSVLLSADGNASAVGAEVTANGIQAVSYRFRFTDVPLFIPDGTIAHALPGVPRALSVFDTSGDGATDTMALFRLFDRVALSMTVARPATGETLGAIYTPEQPIESDDYVLRPLRLLDSSGLQLAAAGPGALLIWDMSKPRRAP